jgi:hypothetical protein
MSRTPSTRKTLRLTEAQAADLDAMIAHYEAEIIRITGLSLSVSFNSFLHALLKKHAHDTGQSWADDYPTPGGRRS